VTARKPKPMGARLVELLLNAVDESTNLRVRVGQGSPNHHHAARARTPHAAPLVHQNGCIPERFRDQNRLAFARVQMEGTARGSHSIRVGSLGNGDPISESRLHGLPNRIVGAACQQPRDEPREESPSYGRSGGADRNSKATPDSLAGYYRRRPHRTHRPFCRV
jgi:hypothetical protein